MDENFVVEQESPCVAGFSIGRYCETGLRDWQLLEFSRLSLGLENSVPRGSHSRDGGLDERQRQSAVLLGPIGRQIAQCCHSDASRQASFNGRLD